MAVEKVNDGSLEGQFKKTYQFTVKLQNVAPDNSSPLQDEKKKRAVGEENNTRMS